MFGRELAARRIANHRSLGDTKQGVMRAIVAGAGKKGLVRGNERQPVAEGEILQLRFDLMLHGKAVALKFDIEPIGKQALEKAKTRFGKLWPPHSEGPVDRAGRSARQ